MGRKCFTGPLRARACTELLIMYQPQSFTHDQCNARLTTTFLLKCIVLTVRIFFKFNRILVLRVVFHWQTILAKTYLTQLGVHCATIHYQP